VAKKKKTVDTSASDALKHNPFAALAGADLPSGPAPAEASAAAPDEPTSPLFDGKVVVRREKKGRGGKTVTRVSGVAAAQREALMGRMKKALGCGATVEGDDVVLLGSLVDRAADWLASEGATRISRSG